MNTIDSTTGSCKDSPSSRRVTWDKMTIHYFEEPGRSSETKAIPAKTKKETAFEAMIVDLSDIFDENSGVELHSVRRRRKSVAFDFESLENSPANSDLFQMGVYAGGISTRKAHSLDEIPSFKQSVRQLTAQKFQISRKSRSGSGFEEIQTIPSISLTQIPSKIRTSLLKLMHYIFSRAREYVIAGFRKMKCQLVEAIANKVKYSPRDQQDSETPVVGSSCGESPLSSQASVSGHPAQDSPKINQMGLGSTIQGLFRRHKMRRVKQAINLIRLCGGDDKNKPSFRGKPIFLNNSSLAWCGRTPKSLSILRSYSAYKGKLNHCQETKKSQCGINAAKKQQFRHARIRHSQRLIGSSNH